MNRFLTSILLAAVSTVAMSQQQVAEGRLDATDVSMDSLFLIENGGTPNVSTKYSSPSRGYFRTAATFYNSFKYDAFPFSRFKSTSRVIPLLFSYPTALNPGKIFNTDNFSLLGSVSLNKFPGLMNMESGRMGFSAGNESLNFYLGGIVNKYGYHGGLVRQIGVNSRFSYQFSSPLSFTAYAYYYGRNDMPMMPNGSFMPPSMSGYYEVSRFGGYVDYRASERFGIQLGGQAVERTSGRNHYEFEPIATPYINVGSGKNKVYIGLPVGQILYGILRR